MPVARTPHPSESADTSELPSPTRGEGANATIANSGRVLRGPSKLSDAVGLSARFASCLRRTVPQASAGCQIRKGADHRLATVEVLRRHSLLVICGCGDRDGLHDDRVSRRQSIRFRHAVDAALGLNGLSRRGDAGLRRGSHRARHDCSRTHTAEEHLHGGVPDTANRGRFDQLQRPPTVPAAATQIVCRHLSSHRSSDLSHRDTVLRAAMKSIAACFAECIIPHIHWKDAPIARHPWERPTARPSAAS